MKQQTKAETEHRRTDPAETEGGQRQEAADGIQRGLQWRAEVLRQSAQQIVEGCGQSDADRPCIDGAVAVKAAPEERQQDQNNG